jgi:hypothetical protein
MTRPHGARHDAAIAPVVTVPGWWARREVRVRALTGKANGGPQ